MIQAPTVMVPIDWKIEMPVVANQDETFGGCSSIEGRYTKLKQIGEGTYGQVCVTACGPSELCRPHRHAGL